MFFRIALHVLTFLALLQSLFKLKLSVLACTEDFECHQNSSVTSICCSGRCKALWNCEGGCFSDDTCEDGKICFRYRCQDQDIDFPAYCSNDRDCLKEEECESGQCKPSPRPVIHDNPDEVQVSFHFDPGIVIIVGSTVGAVIFLALVAYISYRCFKRYRRRRLSRGAYSAPTMLGHGVNSFSSPRNEVETYALYRQHHRARPTLSGSSGFSYPQRPPPEYDSLTLDSNLEVESSSPPPYDPLYRTLSRTSSDEAQVGESFCSVICLFLVLIYWQAWQARMMNRILFCDCLLQKRQDGDIYLPSVSFEKMVFIIPCNKSFIDPTCSVKMARYRSHFLFVCLWTLTSSRSI